MLKNVAHYSVLLWMINIETKSRLFISNCYVEDTGDFQYSWSVPER